MPEYGLISKESSLREEYIQLNSKQIVDGADQHCSDDGTDDHPLFPFSIRKEKGREN